MPPLLNEEGELATIGMEKSEELNKFLASVFIGHQASHTSHIPEPLSWVEQNPPHWKQRKLETQQPHEAECVQAYRAQRQVSQGPEGTGNWLMWLPSHFPPYLKSHVCQVKSPVTEERETSLPFLRKRT